MRPRTSTIHVCPWSLLEQTTDAAGANHVITLLRNHEQVVTPRRVVPANHLRIDINDIAVPMDGMVHPQDEHVAEVIRFARDWDHRSPLVIHCYAGISRSTAAAFVSLCTLNPEVAEARIAKLPFVTPRYHR